MFSFGKTGFCGGLACFFALELVKTNDTDLEPGLTNCKTEIRNSEWTLFNTADTRGLWHVQPSPGQMEFCNSILVKDQKLRIDFDLPF